MFNKPIENITYKDINELLYVKQEAESQILDYKREFHKSGKEFAKDFTAFANAKGGFIIYGIDEKENSIIGVSENINNTKVEDWIANILNSNVDGKVNYKLKNIEINSEEPSSFVVVLEIEESKEKPVYTISDSKAICYIRKGTSIFSAKPNEIKEMYQANLSKDIKQSIAIKQNSRGNHNIQVGANHGTIVKTDKFVKRNEVKPNSDIHISEKQAKTIKDLVDEIVRINEQAGKANNGVGKIYSYTWSSFKNKFNVASYRLLPKEKFEEAVIWLRKEIGYKHQPKLRKNNNSEWKKRIYTAIYTRSQNNLNLEKQEILDLAFDRLKLRKPISSLKELSDTRLKKLYDIIMNM